MQPMFAYIQKAAAAARRVSPIHFGKKESMKRKHIYLILAVAGFAAPYFFFISFVMEYGLDGKAFVRQLFGTPISTFFATDLLLSCAVFVIYLPQETARYHMRHRWLYLVALVTVGLSLSWPLFLYIRDCAIEDKARAPAG
jgi:hypothetical protein